MNSMPMTPPNLKSEKNDMSLSTFLSRVLNENIDDDFSAVTEIYEDGDDTDEPEWEECFSKNEAVKRVRVIRNGIPVSLARSTKNGYKIVYKKSSGTSPEERKMTFAERRARERAAERVYFKKKKAFSKDQQEKRQASIAKRKDYGLEKEEE